MTYPPPPVPPQCKGNKEYMTEMRFDLLYMRTLPGILKIIVILLNIIGCICNQFSAFCSSGRRIYFNVVAHLGIWFSTSMLILYVFRMIEKQHSIKWLRLECVVCMILVFLYLIAATITFAVGAVGFSVAGFVGYLTMAVYGVDAFLKAKALRDAQLQRENRVIGILTDVVTPPALPIV